MITDIDIAIKTHNEVIGKEEKPSVEIIKDLYKLPFNDLISKAHLVHNVNFKPNTVQLSTLVNIKSGACPEDCSYCPQSIRYKTNVSKTTLMSIEAVSYTHLTLPTT